MKKGYEVVSDKIAPKPVVGSFQGIGRATWNWWQVVSELIDNTLTIDRDTVVEIFINTELNLFMIRDNSIGIPGKFLEDVITIGKQVNKGKQLLSYSGVGLKSAIYWMGLDFEIITKPRSEDGHMVYKLTPNFKGNDEADKIALFTLEKWVDENHDYGTEIRIKDCQTLPKKISKINQAQIMLGATYEEHLSSGKLKATMVYIQPTNGISVFQIEPIKPLLTNKKSILDSNLRVGANEWEMEDTLKGKAGEGWEVTIKAGRKLYPETAAKYYGQTDPKLFEDVYSEHSSPYDWSSKTTGINYKMNGKIILFNQEAPSSRAESLCVEVNCIKGIEPAMHKTNMNTSTPEYIEMKEVVKKWLQDNDFFKRTKVGTQHLGENKDVRDKYVQVIKHDELKRTEWGISLDSFDQQVMTEANMAGGRADIYVKGTNKKVIIEAKKEEIKGIDVSQAAGYAVEVEADLILLVAQRRTTSGKAYQSMWKKKLDIDIIFVNILDHYTKNQI